MSEISVEEFERLKRENDILRGIASRIMPCHYCGVDNIAKCPHGFPGCSLADDISCAEDCMAETIRTLNKQIADYKRRLKPSEHDETSRFQWGCLIARRDYLEAENARLKHAKDEAEPNSYRVFIRWSKGEQKFDSDPNVTTNQEEVHRMVDKARLEALDRMRKKAAWDADNFKVVIATVVETELD